MDNSRVVSWRALRCQLNNMLIRYSVEEGIPFLNLSDVLAIAGIEAGNAASKIPDSFCRVVHDGNSAISVVTIPGAILSVLSTASPDYDLFVWLTNAPALISKGISQRFDATADLSASGDYLKILHAEADTHLQSLGLAMGDVRKVIWTSPAMEPAKDYVNKAEEQMREARASLRTAFVIARTRAS